VEVVDKRSPRPLELLSSVNYLGERDVVRRGR